jgi:hypothetical protein
MTLREGNRVRYKDGRVGVIVVKPRFMPYAGPRYVRVEFPRKGGDISLRWCSELHLTKIEPDNGQEVENK